MNSIYGLIGYPVQHSYSAVMHNAAFKELGINAEYRLIPVPPEELKGFFLNNKELLDIDGKSIFIKDLSGLNVTIPHKTEVLNYIKLGNKSIYLKSIEAVNTLVREEGVWKGFNTDILGFLRHAREEGIVLEDKKVVIIGAGGAARAVVYALIQSNAAEIVICDINDLKCNELIKMIKKRFNAFNIKYIDKIKDGDLIKKDILINATPVGMKPDDSLLVKKEWLRPELFVYDLIYNPTETKLLKAAKEAGCRCSNGLGMLLHQGVEAFRLWTGEAPVEVMRRALLEKLNGG